MFELYNRVICHLSLDRSYKGIIAGVAKPKIITNPSFYLVEIPDYIKYRLPMCSYFFTLSGQQIYGGLFCEIKNIANTDHDFAFQIIDNFKNKWAFLWVVGGDLSAINIDFDEDRGGLAYL